MKHKIKVTRAFLNSKEGMAAMMVRTVLPGPYHERDDGYGGSPDCNLSLSDCGRQITLDFDAFDEKDIKERFKKIDKIRAALNQIEDTLIQYYFEAGVLTDAERKACRLARDGEGKQKPRTISIAYLEDYLDE
jgi:hypothetical protein